jgi:acylphosphatase
MQNHKVHIKVKNRPLNPLYSLITRVRAKRLGLKTHKITSADGKIEMVFEGQNPELWKMIEHCKKGVTFSYVKEVHFEFVKA